MPQLEHVQSRRHVHHRGDLGVVEVRAERLRHQRVDARLGHVDPEQTEDAHRPLVVREFR